MFCHRKFLPAPTAKYLVTLLLSSFVTVTVLAHVPYLECDDWTEANPFVLHNPVQSTAIYSQLDDANDVDVFEMTITESPTLLFAQIIVPLCEGYDTFAPSLVIVGPGFSEPNFTVPIKVPTGQGAVLVSGEQDREIYDECFVNKKYYRGATFEQDVTELGTYKVVVYDPVRNGIGDYTVVLGKEEIWCVPDIMRALVLTPLMRWGNIELDEGEDCERINFI